MKTTKLLTILFVFFLFGRISIHGQCSFITVNGSSQDPNSVCAPVDFTMDAVFRFMVPVDTSLVRILYRWNDAAGATSLVPGNWNAAGDSVWSSVSHIYPPDDECSKTAEAILVYDGELCESSGYQEQTFATWGTDEENSGVLNIEPPVYYVCEGEEIIDVTFDDNSTFNCNIAIEPDRPNRYYRWVQFIYNTYNQGGDRIPNVSVVDSLAVSHQMTDAAGVFAGNLYGPVVQIPIPADGPNQTSYPISAPAGGVAGDIFEITLRNWNVCNPYDNNPTDGIPPADIVNGDNAPIITTARIEIIAPPPVTVVNPIEYCTGDAIILSATAGGADVRWYKDAGLDTLLFTGNNIDASLPPLSLDPNMASSDTFYVTSFDGMCESAPGTVILNIYETPATANAGTDQVICSDTISLHANAATAGTGTWTTTGGAVFSDMNNPDAFVSNLDFGDNVFTWAIENGPCNTMDIVHIISDRQPDASEAGNDQYLCDTDPVTLSATPPNMGGNGYWNMIGGAGVISDSTNPGATLTGLAIDTNVFVWRVASAYGACPVTIDTVLVVADKNAGLANAGTDIELCEDDSYMFTALAPVNNGTGTWNILSGGGIITDTSNPHALVQNLTYGTNRFTWTLQSALGICPSSSDTIDIERYQSPGISSAGSDKEYCLITRDTLHANSPAYGSGRWNVIANPSGSAPVFTPSNLDPQAIFSVLPGNEGLYQLEWQLQNGACISSDTVAIDFGVPVPPANAGPDTVTCGYSYAMQGNPAPIGRGEWTQLSGPGTTSFVPDETFPGAVVHFNPGEEGVYEFQWELSSGSCPGSTDRVEIEIKKAPLAPPLTDRQSCGPDTFLIALTITDPDQLGYWYHTNTSTSVFQVGDSYNTGTLAASEDYFVSIYDTATHCESPRSEIVFTIDDIPARPILLGDTLCGPGTPVYHGIVSLPADNIIWYSDGSLTGVVDTSFVYISDTIATSTRVWGRSYVSSTGCMSEADSVQSIVWPTIPAPVTYNESSCGSSDFMLHADKSGSSNILFWYNESGSLVSIGDSMATAIIDSTTLFYVAEYNPLTYCLSNRSELRVSINDIPEYPVISDTSHCGAASFVLEPLSANHATTIRWYTDAVTNSLISQSDTFLTPLLISNTSYWLAGYNELTGCEGPREEIKIDIYPSPAAMNILGPTVVLKDQTDVVFFTINGLPGSLFDWTIPVEINLEADMNDFVRLGFPNLGTYAVSAVETTADGCIGDPVYHSISVIHDSIVVDIGDLNQNACTAEPFEIKPWLFGGAPPYTYSWSGDVAYLSSTNTLFTTFNPPGIGQYHLYLEVADVNLRMVRDTVVITVYESPVTQILNTDTIACVDENYLINTSNTGTAPFTYLWTGPIHNLSGYTVANPVYVPRQADTATFYYMLTDVNGCRAYDSITLLSDKPVADFDILTPPGCSPVEVVFRNSSTNAVSYAWDFDDETSSTAVNPAHVYVNSTSMIKYYEVSMEATSILGCTDNSVGYAMVWPNPVADLTALPQTSCNPSNTLLVSTPGNSVYYWDFGDGSADTVTSGFNLYHSYTNETFDDQTYKARVITRSSLNCYDTAETDITIYATPVAGFTITPDEKWFPDNRFEITNLTAGEWDSYLWNFGYNDQYSSERDPLEITYDEPGNFTVSYTVSGLHCSDSISRSIRLRPAPPSAQFKGADNGCMPHTVNLVNYSQYAESFLWEFGDGSISTSKDPSYTYYEPGIYKIKLTAVGPGGTDVYSDTSRVFVLPNSFFDIAPRYVYVNDEPVHYFNLSDNGHRYEWDFGDGTVSDEFNPTHVYKQEGTFDVTLKVWTDKECFDLYIMENAVFAEPTGKVEFPNVFRPDSPLEENRTFKPGIIDHVDDYHLMIFNRWGELIYENFDQDIGWDGFYNGQLSKQDVYIWKVTGTFSDGKGFTKTGNVTLLY